MGEETWGYLVEEMEQVEFLQQSVIDKMWEASQTDDAKYLVEYYHHFYALMEKQHILWTRLRLMRNENLKGIEIAIEQLCDALGKPPSQSVEAFHASMREEIKDNLSSITGEDLDAYDGIDVDFKWK